MRGGRRTTPPHRAPVACGLGTLCRTCGTSWNFASAWRYNHTTWNFVGTLRYFLDICEIFAIQPTPTAPRSFVARGSGLPMVARPHGSLRSRFFVSPLIGGAQQRGLRPRHSLAMSHAYAYFRPNLVARLMRTGRQPRSLGGALQPRAQSQSQKHANREAVLPSKRPKSDCAKALAILVRH